MPESYVVHVGATESGGSHVVMVLADRGEVRSPASGPGRPEIGVYRTPLPPERFTGLVAAIEAAGLGVHGPADPIPAGDLVVTLGIMDGRTPRAMHTYRVAEPPPALAPAIALVDEVREEIYEHPFRVLRSSFTWSVPKIVAGEDLRGAIRFEGVGKESVTFRSPCGTADDPPPRTGIVFFRPGPDSAREFFREVIFGPGDVRPKGTEAGPAPEGGHLVLAAGASQEFSVRSPVRLLPGSFAGLFFYASAPEGDAPKDFTAGAIDFDTPPLRVT